MGENFQIDYVKITKDDENYCKYFLNLGYDYMKEVVPEVTIDMHNKFIKSILNLQN